MQPNSFEGKEGIPFEDHRRTKDIIRMQMQQLAWLFHQKRPYKEVHAHLLDIEKEIAYWKNSSLLQYTKNFHDFLEKSWPLEKHIDLEKLQKMQSFFRYLDDETLY